MVAAVVLDEEVAVGALGERDLAEPALFLLPLVAEFVGGVDGDAADAADRDGQADLVDDGPVGGADQVHRDDEAGVLQRRKA